MKDAVLVDIDGTIALRGDRSPHAHDEAMEDGVNWSIVNLVNKLDFPVVLISGRDMKYREVTEYWLYAHNLFVDRECLVMRHEKDNRADEIVKKELYEKFISRFYRVQWVFDDRDKVVKMWRELGLTCLQVAEGNF